MKANINKNKLGFDYFVELLAKRWLLVHYTVDETYEIVHTRKFYCIRGFYNTLAAKYLRTCCVNNQLWARCEMTIKNYLTTQQKIVDGASEGKDEQHMSDLRKRLKQYEDTFFELSGKSISGFLCSM